MGTVEAAKPAAVRAAKDGDIERYYLASPPPPDWERLIEDGTVPALVLGAERRLRRDR